MKIKEMAMKTKASLSVALILASALCSACASSPADELPPPDEITVQLKWVHQD